LHLDVSERKIGAAVPFAEQLAATLHSVDAYRSTAELARDMAEAMRSRAVIQQAKGILMSDRRIDADGAFDQLVRISTQTNLKLRDVPRRLVDDRSKPE
jgi:AmiR/NasT family two-component response regulator